MKDTKKKKKKGNKDKMFQTNFSFQTRKISRD